MLKKSKLPEKFLTFYFDGRGGLIGRLRKKVYERNTDEVNSFHIYTILTKESNTAFGITSNMIGGSLLPKEEYMDKWIEESNEICELSKKSNILDSMKMRYDLLEKYYRSKNIFDDTCIVSLEIIGENSKTYNNLKKNPVCTLLFTVDFHYYKQTTFQFNCVAEIADKNSRLYRFLNAMQFVYHIEEPLREAVCAYKFNIIETWIYEAPYNSDISKLIT